jgi:hypothetical protein
LRILDGIMVNIAACSSGAVKENRGSRGNDDPLAIDPGTRCGYAIGEAGSIPRSGSVRLKRLAALSTVL